MGAQKPYWRDRFSILENEDGTVLIATILILALLTIIGVASVRVSNTEVQISGNELRYYQHVYRAEGATMEAIEQIELSIDPNDGSLTWLETAVDAVTDDAIETWQFEGTLSPQTSVLDSPGIADTSFIAVSEGVVPGSTLDVTSSKVYGYNIYGRSSLTDRGASTIEIGYRKAF